MTNNQPNEVLNQEEVQPKVEYITEEFFEVGDIAFMRTKKRRYTPIRIFGHNQYKDYRIQIIGSRKKDNNTYKFKDFEDFTL